MPVEWLSRVSPSILIAAAAVLAAATLLSGNFLLGPHNRLPYRDNNASLPMGDFGPPVLQLELVRSNRDIVQILAPGDKARNIEEARAGNHLDNYVFIPLYAMTLIVTGLAVIRGYAHPSVAALYLVVAASATIAACDYAENHGIERTLRHMASEGQPAAGDAAAIANPGKAKWILLFCLAAVYAAAAFWADALAVKLFGIVPALLAVFTGKLLLRYFLTELPRAGELLTR